MSLAQVSVAAQPMASASAFPPSNDNRIRGMNRRIRTSRRRWENGRRLRHQVQVLRFERDVLPPGPAYDSASLRMWATQYRAEAWEALAEGDAAEAARLRRSAVAFTLSAWALAVTQ
ncbi:hypothetical protein BKE38_04025 [Pseudoroseomonas deserti]|uniref:Uncharacterized protein n=1 Tax=Teichococcus deserti TaxID=1817963 RepID=A0A1V2H6E9_9PROT|nr:hypothetical protein [Pseudoroseomonas deserti]ONG57327.1 hypothetical protein BKE38_04025 [Pseudoroseomonas deserti]